MTEMSIAGDGYCRLVWPRYVSTSSPSSLGLRGRGNGSTRAGRLIVEIQWCRRHGATLGVHDKNERGIDRPLMIQLTGDTHFARIDQYTRPDGVDAHALNKALHQNGIQMARLAEAIQLL